MITFKGIEYDIAWMNTPDLMKLFQLINDTCSHGKQAHNLKRLYMLTKELETRKNEFRLMGAL